MVLLGVFAGMSQDQLRAALTAAQTAYTQLLTGSKVETVSYAQGDGSKSVTYSRANIANLTAMIGQLQQALGLGTSRRTMRFRHF